MSTALQQDSKRRLREIDADIKDAKRQGKMVLFRQLTKEYEDEAKVLAMIIRVEALIAAEKVKVAS